MAQIRDIVLKRQSQLNTKADQQIFRRAVLTTEGGELTADDDPTTEVWADRTERRVWYMADGATQPAQILCRKVSNPYVGLGVIIGRADNSNEIEVLSTDFFLTHGTDVDGWDATAPDDLEPGGNKVLWVYTKVITPLATVPASTGLVVSVIAGDYPYGGIRKTYNGSAAFTLTQNPNAGEHYYAGLYLDANNILQVVYGASVSTALTAPDPTFPSSAFQLSQILIDDVQTSIDFVDDLVDLRMPWSDENSSEGWPFANVITVSLTDPNADYSTITAALAVATSGTIILIDGGTYTETLTVSVACTLIGLGENQTIITTATNASVTVDCTPVAGVTLRNLTITNTGVGASSVCVSTNDTIIDGCIIRKTSGAATISIGVNVGGGTNYVIIRDCDILVTAGTGKYGISVSATSIVFIENGRIGGTTNDVLANTTTVFIDPVLVNSLVGGTAGRGQYYTTAGNLITIDSTGQTAGVWLIDESATLRIKETDLAAAITAAASGDTIKLDTDTYSLTTHQNIGVSVTIEGDGPEATIITNSVNNDACFDITAAVTVIFRNLAIKMTGGGAAITGIFSNDATAVILDNCVIDISSGSPTDTRGLWIETGTWTLRNGSKIICTVGTNKYGIYNDAGATTITIGAGCEINGATADIYGDQTGSTLKIFGGLITNNQINFAGVIERSGNTSFERARPNPIINGSFLIWQRGTSFAAIANAAYSADRWIYSKVGAVVHTVTQDTSAPTVAQAGCLIPYSIKLDVTTADSSIAAGDFCTIGTKIEGFNFLPLAQRQFTLSFWVRDTKTGIHCVAFRNSGSDRSYIAEYTINTADTWEYKTITVTPSPSAGTWDYTNGVGLFITWALSCGSTFQTTAGAWQTGNYLGTSNQVNATDNTANNFYLTGVRIEPGSVATPLILPDYGNEKRRCKRYCIVLDASDNASDQGFGRRATTTTVQITVTLQVEMRAAPALTHNITGYTSGAPGTTTVALLDFTNAGGTFLTITGALTVSLATANTVSARLLFTAGTSWSGTNGDICVLRIGPSVVAELSAEL